MNFRYVCLAATPGGSPKLPKSSEDAEVPRNPLAWIHNHPQCCLNILQHTDGHIGAPPDSRCHQKKLPRALTGSHGLSWDPQNL